MIALRNVLVATDFSPPSDVALEYGRALARSFGASLHLLHVSENHFLRASFVDDAASDASHARWVAERLTADDRTTLHAQAIVEVADSPAAAIVEYAKSASVDLIVMGTHGRTAMSQLLVGSVAERVVRTAPCPVLTVRRPEHEFVIPDASPKRDDHDSPQEDTCRH